MFLLCCSTPWRSRWTSRRLENWFQNSLKQLSAVQQKQVGAILGSCVADAAARPWMGWTPDRIRAWQLEQQQLVAHHSLTGGSSSSLAWVGGGRYAVGSMDVSPYFYGVVSDPTAYKTETRRHDANDGPRLVAPPLPAALLPKMASAAAEEESPQTGSGAGEKPPSPSPSSQAVPLAFAELEEGDTNRLDVAIPPCRDKLESRRSAGPSSLVDVGLEEEDGGGAEEEEAMLQVLFHSYSYRLQAATVRSLAASQAEVNPELLKERWVEEAVRTAAAETSTAGPSAGPAVVAREHGTLLNCLAAVLPLPTLYPYASDAALHECCGPLLEFLMARPDPAASHGSSSPFIPPVALQEALNTVRQSMILTYSSVLLRCLQNNPHPIRNTALLVSMSGPPLPFAPVERLVGTAATGHDAAAARRADAVTVLQSLFPLEIQKECFGRRVGEEGPAVEPQLHQALRRLLLGKAEVGNDTLSTALLELWAELLVLRESLSMVLHFTSHTAAMAPSDAVERAVEASVALGCPAPAPAPGSDRTGAALRPAVVTHRASLVGALLGARYGVRAIPPRWLSAAVDHAAVASLAVEVAQWSWNPRPSREW